MNTVDCIFTNLGGTGALAKIIGVKHSAASEMRRRGSIPVKYWQRLIAGASDIGVSIDSDLLVHIHAVPEAAE